jgi:3-deoxy-D-manno-octulosonic-acid transferase
MRCGLRAAGRAERDGVGVLMNGRASYQAISVTTDAGPYTVLSQDAIQEQGVQQVADAGPPRATYRDDALPCSLPPRMLRLVYNTLIYVAAPFALLANLWRGVRDPAYRDRLGERFGFARVRADQSIWLHAVSVGEVQAGAALVRELARRHPQRTLIVTTGTPTGAQRVQALFGASVRHVYLPYDLPGATRRFLDRVKPRVAIVMETEVWPNLFRECARRRIPLLIASARLSPKSVRGYRWLASLFKDALASGIQIAAQTQGDADRFISVGANPANTHVVGNIKFDLELAADLRSRGQLLRVTQFPDREVWVAGSTHAGEEDIVLAAHAQLLQSHPRALLVLVPRHPQRFDEVKAGLRTRSIEFVARSSQTAPTDKTAVLLVDALGELTMFYAAADIAFVGGSLVPIGGHNLLEPAALALPVLTGPYNFNSPEVANALLARDAALEIGTSEQLATTLASLFDNRERRERLGANALSFVAGNRGALQRLLELIEPRCH